jgi:peptidoglycan/xylan/chitin deacetylase (PgdA/CDA1 family)
MFRRSTALLSAALLLVSGCGVQMRHTDPKPVVVSRPNPVFPPVNPVPLSAPGQTVVSITFDDGRESNLAAAAMLMKGYGLAGTFYINSGNVGLTGYLSLPDLDTIAEEGHEIAGHTLKHKDLSTVPAEEARKQICDDRQQLLAWGFQVRNFAYPFASASPALQQIVADCGYNSARSLGELKTVNLPDNAEPGACELCSWYESMPPANPMYVKAPGQIKSDWTYEDLKTQVTRLSDGDGSPYSGDGGWVVLTFHGVCPPDCTDIGVATSVLNQFLGWLAGQQAQGHLIVRTVGDVIGGEVKP